jgi:hypothetical protein
MDDDEFHYYKKGQKFIINENIDHGFYNFTTKKPYVHVRYIKLDVDYYRRLKIEIIQRKYINKK